MKMLIESPCTSASSPDLHDPIYLLNGGQCLLGQVQALPMQGHASHARPQLAALHQPAPPLAARKTQARTRKGVAKEGDKVGFCVISSTGRREIGVQSEASEKGPSLKKAMVESAYHKRRGKMTRKVKTKTLALKQASKQEPLSQSADRPREKRVN